MRLAIFSAVGAGWLLTPILNSQIAFAQDPPQVQIVAVTCADTAAGPEVEGEIKNITDQPIEEVVLSAVFHGASGTFISTTSIEAEFDPILPGQVSPFSGFGESNPEIASVQLTPAIADGGSLPASGKNTVPCS